MINVTQTPLFPPSGVFSIIEFLTHLNLSQTYKIFESNFAYIINNKKNHSEMTN